MTEVFSRGGFCIGPGFHCSDNVKGVIYLEHQERIFGDDIIDSYEIETGEYKEKIATGMNFNRYKTDVLGYDTHDHYSEIKNKLTVDVSKELLAATEEGRTLIKYGPYLEDPTISFFNGKIFISYHARFVDVTFEYDEEKNGLNYLCYNMTSEIQGVETIYLY